MPPNYTLHLEVAAYINEKKANNPRDAATLIARLACNPERTRRAFSPSPPLLSRAGRRPSALSPQRVPLPSCPLRSPLRLLAPQPSQLVPTPVPLEHGP
ncbi:hypothetical protein B0H14DRAFT_3057841, partial [Mycena olivaceomarginata]